MLCVLIILPPTVFCEAEFNCDITAKGALILNAMTVANYSKGEH